MAPEDVAARTRATFAAAAVLLAAGLVVMLASPALARRFGVPLQTVLSRAGPR